LKFQLCNAKIISLLFFFVANGMVNILQPNVRSTLQLGGGGDPLERVKQFSANPSEQNGVTGPHNKVAAAASAVRGKICPQHALIHEQQEQ
jgi:hypothetical protein